MDKGQVCGLILTEHFLSVDSNTIDFLSTCSTNGCVQFLLNEEKALLLIRPIKDPSYHSEKELATYRYLVDDDGQAIIMQAEVLTDYIMGSQKMYTRRMYYFPGKVVESAKSIPGPLIIFDLSAFSSCPIPDDDESMNSEEAAHRTAQKEQHNGTDTE